MICSFSTGKSNSSWLDRLRNAKGFPQDGATDLENYLQNPSSPNFENPSQSPSSDQKPDPIYDANKNEDKQLFNVVSSVIRELFNFGDNCSNSKKGKKSARKQANPRICAFSSDNDNVVSEKVASRSGDSNCGVEGVKKLTDRKNEGEVDANLLGFSRTEVTVIDTSYDSWKFEMLLFRKKNVWKVRDKKAKSECFGMKKKRKVNENREEDQIRGKKKKVEGKEGRGVEYELPSNEMLYTRNQSEEAHERTPDKVGNVLKKKLPRKFETGSSSIIFMKSVPTSKRNGAGISKNYLKLKQNKS